MKTLEDVFQSSKNAERRFRYRRVVFIPSESYCAATITIMQGLQKLGFEIVVPYRSNINSWFCETVVDDVQLYLDKNPIDFALSNLHWGTRWDYYSSLGLDRYFKVLIDGDDSRLGNDWKRRYDGWCRQYGVGVPSGYPGNGIFTGRWMAPLGSYWPDLAFSSQLAPNDKQAVYLPFGIHLEHMWLGPPFSVRSVRVTNIPGDGPARTDLTQYINYHLQSFPHPLHNSPSYGGWDAPLKIHNQCTVDQNVHSWQRWRSYRNYYDVLCSTRIFIHPGVFDDKPQWHSKREFEALGCGCLVLMKRPNIDMSSYPMTELYPDAVYDSDDEMLDKCYELEMPHGYTNAALRYFHPETLARRFLWYVSERM